MKVIPPDLKLRKISDVKPGELVHAQVHGETSLGIITAQTADDGDAVLGAWLRFGDHPPTLRYADATDYCVSFGGEWVLEPHYAELLAFTGGAPAPVPGWLYLTADGWLVLLEGNNRETELWSLATGVKVSHRVKALQVFPSYSLWASSESRDMPGAKPIFSFPGPQS